MRDIPLSVIATWPTPNYTDPATRGPALTILTGILIALITLTIGLRYYARMLVTQRFGSDDALMGLAGAAAVGLDAAVMLAVLRYGWDRHIWDVPPMWSEPALKVAVVGKVLFALATTWTRMSFLLFLGRVVSGSGIVWFRWVVGVAHVWVLSVGLVSLGFSVFQCFPVSAYWTFPPHPSFSAHCIPEGPTLLANGILNTLTDLFVTLLPTPLIMALHIPLTRRVAILALLSLGYGVTAAGAARTWFIYKSLIASWDLSWWAFPLWAATCVEVSLGVVGGCVPALRPLWTRVVAGRFVRGRAIVEDTGTPVRVTTAAALVRGQSESPSEKSSVEHSRRDGSWEVERPLPSLPSSDGKSCGTVAPEYATDIEAQQTRRREPFDPGEKSQDSASKCQCADEDEDVEKQLVSRQRSRPLIVQPFSNGQWQHTHLNEHAPSPKEWTWL